jgi:hypothetical protein
MSKNTRVDTSSAATVSHARLRALVEAVREARGPAMAGVTAPVLDEGPMPAYLMAVESLSEAVLSTPELLALLEAAERWARARAVKRITAAAVRSAFLAFDADSSLREGWVSAGNANLRAHEVMSHAFSNLAALCDTLHTRREQAPSPEDVRSNKVLP